MNIQWYPGHMAKAKRQIQELMKQIDVVIEVTDARVPTVPVIRTFLEIYRKPRILAVTKCDLMISPLHRFGFSIGNCSRKM